MLTRAGFDPDGHSGKALINVLETYPRDELFQIDEDMLFQFAQAILQLDERPRVRVLPRDDRFDRFVSVLVYVPRDRYSGDGARTHRRAIWPTSFTVTSAAFYPFFPEGPMIRVHYIIGRDAGRDAATRRGRRSRRRSPPSCAPGSTSSATTLAHAYDPRRAARAVRALSRRVLRRLLRELLAGRRGQATRGSSKGCRPTRPLGVDFHRQPGSDGSTRRA